MVYGLLFTSFETLVIKENGTQMTKKYKGRLNVEWLKSAETWESKRWSWFLVRLQRSRSCWVWCHLSNSQGLVKSHTKEQKERSEGRMHLKQTEITTWLDLQGMGGMKCWKRQCEMFLTSAQLTRRERKMPRGILIVILERRRFLLQKTRNSWKTLQFKFIVVKPQ